jgi:outer membrane immunogenic protein
MRHALTATIAAAAVFGTVAAAWAADLPAPTGSAPAAMAAPATTWTSCYIGGNIGGGTTTNAVNDETPPHASYGTLDSTAFVGGGQVGCDYQFDPHWVVGIQGMFDGSGFSASTSGAPDLSGLTLSGKIPWFATVTGRLGYLATPDMMLYAKGGAAWDHTDTTLSSGGVTVASASFGQSGWTAGGGVEWRFKPHWSIFAEYDYMGFADKVVSLTGGGTNIGKVHQDTQVGLVGLNFHFGD